MEEKKDFRKSISDLLANYEDGQAIFKKAKDWNYPVTLKDGVEQKGKPESWLELADKVISIIAHEKYNLKTYPNVIEVIDANQMLDAYVKVGMPVGYDHWSHGKQRMALDKKYKGGEMGLAYEIVINTDPAIAYCMEQNSKTMQMLVIAHASYGHNSFFKNNHLFKQFTKPAEIIDDLLRLKKFIGECEEKYGEREVEKVLDSCHALQSHGVNRYTKPKRRSPAEEEARRAHFEALRQQSVDDVMDRAALKKGVSTDFKEAANDDKRIPDDMEENILKFIASDAPHLKGWQRRIISEIADVAQYFYPQRQTQVMNEGWASFWHYTIMTDLREENLIDDGMYLEFLKSHTGVLHQPDFDKPYFSGFNPYALGFAIYNDIKRMTEEPTEEDKKWFPHLAGKGNWLDNITEAMENFKDESFILQYLSPKVMRDFRMFSTLDDEKNDYIEIDAIHSDEGYRKVRENLSSQYRLGDNEPRIEVADYDFKGDRSLTLRHVMHNDRPVADADMEDVLKYAFRLWGHPVVLESVTPEGEVKNGLSMPVSYYKNKTTRQGLSTVPRRRGP